MEEDKNNNIIKYKINDEIHSLIYFKSLFDISHNIKIIGELDIEPFSIFSLEFSSIYWYFKYSILKYNGMNIDRDEIRNDYRVFFQEQNLNLIFFNFYDESNYRLYCVDGTIYVEVYNRNTDLILKNNYNWT